MDHCQTGSNNSRRREKKVWIKQNQTEFIQIEIYTENLCFASPRRNILWHNFRFSTNDNLHFANVSRFFLSFPHRKGAQHGEDRENHSHANAKAQLSTLVRMCYHKCKRRWRDTKRKRLCDTWQFFKRRQSGLLRQINIVCIHNTHCTKWNVSNCIVCAHGWMYVISRIAIRLNARSVLCVSYELCCYL